jgi:hypothetical protein
VVEAALVWWRATGDRESEGGAVTKVVWNALIAVGMLAFFFVTRSAASLEHGLRNGWYIAHNDAIWFEVIAVGGFVIFTISAVKAYIDLRGD